MVYNFAFKMMDFAFTRMNFVLFQMMDWKGTRWMAPEAQPTAEFEFGEASEVYSWGVLLYELFARGAVPYATVGNATGKRGDSARQATRRPSTGATPTRCATVS